MKRREEGQSAVYYGSVAHRRLKPKRHYLRYRLFQLLIDLDELDDLDQRLRFLSVGRFNLFSIHEKDFGPDGQGTLKERLLALADREGIDLGPDASIRSMTMPRLLGYAFNPLTVHFCYAADKRLAAILYEVHNTFGERHIYALPVDASAALPITQTCAKAFHVSPFLPMDLTYDFIVHPPEDDFSIAIRDRDREGLVLTATMAMKRHPLTDRELLRQFFALPLMTLKVIVGIHYEALRLWMKGFKIFRHPGTAN
jgi:DUF1365 family protein